MPTGLKPEHQRMLAPLEMEYLRKLGFSKAEAGYMLRLEDIPDEHKHQWGWIRVLSIADILAQQHHMDCGKPWPINEMLEDGEEGITCKTDDEIHELSRETTKLIENWLDELHKEQSNDCRSD